MPRRRHAGPLPWCAITSRMKLAHYRRPGGRESPESVRFQGRCRRVQGRCEGFSLVPRCVTPIRVEVEPQLGRRDAEVADSDGIPEPKLPRAIDLLPSVSAPKGGGAIRGLDEKFSVNAATGTCAMVVPVPLSPGRSGFTPWPAAWLRLRLRQWAVRFRLEPRHARVTRKTNKGLPRIAMTTSRMSSSWPAPRTWSRCWTRPEAARRLPRTVSARVTGSPSTGRASRACSPHRALDRNRPPASATGGICHATTSRRSTALTRRAGSRTRPTPPGSSPGRSAGAGTTRATWRSTPTPPRTAPGSTRQRHMKPTAPRGPAPRRPTSRQSGTETSSPTSPTGRRADGELPADWMFSSSSTTEITPRAADPGPISPGRRGLTRSRPIAADSSSGPTGGSSGCCSSTTSLPSRRPARTALSGRSTWSTPTSGARRPPQPRLHLPRLGHPDRLPARRRLHPGRCRRSNSTTASRRSSRRPDPRPRQPGQPARRSGRRQVPVGRPRRRRPVRHPDAARRRLVLQAEPQRRQSGRPADGTLAARASFGPLETVATLPSRRSASGVRLSRPVRQRPSRCRRPDRPDPGFFERTGTRTSSRCGRSRRCPHSTGRIRTSSSSISPATGWPTS